MEIIGILTALVGGLWAWSKYIIERSLIPPTEFSLDYNLLGMKGKDRVIEFLLFLKNIGHCTLVAKDIKIRVRYLTHYDDISIFTDKKEGAKFGRLNFFKSRSEDFSKCEKEFMVIRYDTFVQPGVKQVYTFVTTLPEDAFILLVKGEFKYAQNPTELQRVILWISKQLGLINWSLYNIENPHSIERCFNIGQEKKS